MTDMIVEPQRQLPVAAEVDVIVAGGGPGGLPAAIAAARHGAKVLLVERYGFLGGLATAGLVAPILGHTSSRAHTPIVEGLLKELTERMHALDGALSWEEACQEWGVHFDAEALKRVADQMVHEAGVELMLHTIAAGVLVEHGQIQALIVENKSGRQALRAQVYVDGTGDADLAHWAGAPTTKGRDFDGRMESMGSFIHIGGIDGVTEAQAAAARQALRGAMARGEFRFYNDGFTANNTATPGQYAANMTRWPGDSTKVCDLTQAEIGIREQIWKLWAFLRQQPGFERCTIRQTSPQVGPRESRQAVGDYVLTGDDVQAGRKFDDAIARGSWWIDIHCPLGHAYPVHLCIIECPRQEACSFWAAEHESTMRHRADLYPPDDDWYDIPYRCLTPQRVDNLLVSGRCISATHQGMAGARVMGTCCATGQAAGTAAALAVRSKLAPRHIDVARLQDTLRADGALV